MLLAAKRTFWTMVSCCKASRLLSIGTVMAPGALRASIKPCNAAPPSSTANPTCNTFEWQRAQLHAAEQCSYVDNVEGLARGQRVRANDIARGGAAAAQAN